MAVDVYLTPDELVARLKGHVTKKTLANWRSDSAKPGPQFARLGGRIFYPLDKVEEWERARMYGTTRDYGKRAA